MIWSHRLMTVSWTSASPKKAINWKSSDGLTRLIGCGIRLDPLCQIINNDHDVSVSLSCLRHLQNVHSNTLEGASNGYWLQEWSGFKTRSLVGSTREVSVTVKVNILIHSFPPLVLCNCLVKTFPGKWSWWLSLTLPASLKYSSALE